jgi:glutamate-ammonia-ligase adenylyltransferase
MRLRPSGSAGPVAVGFTAFADYQRNEAWTWEHMALTRARVICGAPALAKKIAALRTEILTRKRDEKKLLADVASMRKRMADHARARGPWDLKQQRGGTVDLEFIVQYLLLRHGAAAPAVLHCHPADALAAIGEAGLLKPKPVATLLEACRLYATLLAVSRLAGHEEASDPARWPPALAKRLPTLVGSNSLDALTARLAATQQAVLALFGTLIETPAAPHLALADSLATRDPATGHGHHEQD